MFSRLTTPTQRLLRAQGARFFGSSAEVETHKLPDTSKVNLFTAIRAGLSQFISFSRMPQVPLTQPFPNVNIPSNTTAAPLENAQITTLSNGMRVASLENSLPVSSLCLYIDVGTGHIPSKFRGLLSFMEALSFESNEQQTAMQLVRETTERGIGISATAARDGFQLTAECLRDNIPLALQTLSNVVLRHKYDSWQVDDVREYISKQVDLQKSVPPELTDCIHRAAYAAGPLGASPVPTLSSLELFSSDLLKQYAATLFHPGRMILSGVGLNHEELVRLANSYFKVERPLPDLDFTPSPYIGGESRVEHDLTYTHVALGFEGPGWKSPDLTALIVLQNLLGGGGSFSSGGPGKGMHSRLYNNVLNHYGWVVHCASFCLPYQDSSIFGVVGEAAHERAVPLIDLIANQLIALKGHIDDVELTRAKNRVKSQYFVQIENRTSRAEDIARQLASFGKIKSLSQVAAEVDSITGKDLNRLAEKILASPLSYAAVGEVEKLPAYNQLQATFKSK